MHIYDSFRDAMQEAIVFDEQVVPVLGGWAVMPMDRRYVESAHVQDIDTETDFLFVQEVILVAHRFRRRRGPDRRYFTRTAVRAKKINLNPTIMRGGIRL